MVLLAVLAPLLAPQPPAQGQTDFSWQDFLGNYSGNWSETDHWTPAAGPPGASDTATIDATPGAAYTILLDIDPTLAVLTMDSQDAILSGAGSTVTVTNALNLLEGTVTGTPTFELSGTVDVTLGAIGDYVGDATFLFQLGTTGTFNTADNQLVAGRELELVSGWLGHHQTHVTITAAEFTNHGTITMGTAAAVNTLQVDAGGVLSGTLTNYGTLETTGSRRRTTYSWS